MQTINKPLAIIGSGDHGAVIADIARALGIFPLIEFYDDKFERKKTILSLLDSDPESNLLVIAIGNNKIRLELAHKFDQKGFKFATLLHPTIVLGTDVEVGVGTVAMARTVINYGSKIGKHCILNTGSTVDHHGRFEDGVHIGPGVNLAGNVTLKEGVFLGVGSCVIPDRMIRSFSVVGAGATIINDIEAGRTVVGVLVK